MDRNKIFEIIKKASLEALDKGVHPIAAFDADGTLWHDDISHAFFKRYYGEREGFWDTFYEIQKKCYKESLVWLAQSLEGQSYKKLKSDCHEVICKNQSDKIDLSEKLIRFLQDEKVEIFVVTGSLKWISEEKAHLYYNIPKDHVLGIKTKLQGDTIMSEVEGHLTWEEGKRDSLLAHTQNKNPFLCAGNTMGDLALLEVASHVKVAMNRSCPQSKKVLYDSEIKLKELAQDRNWLISN